MVVEIMYNCVAFLAKLSLFLLHHRLFSIYKWMRYLVYLGIGSIFVLYATCAAVDSYLCLPHRGETWLQAAVSSRCHQQAVLVAYIQGPFNVASDLFLLLLPLPAVLKLQVPLRKKLGISTIFLTGSLSVIESFFLGFDKTLISGVELVLPASSAYTSDFSSILLIKRGV